MFKRDGVFYSANAQIKNNKSHLHSVIVKKQINIRYGWKNYFDPTHRGNFRNTLQL